MKPEELLTFLIDKIKSGELETLNENYKRKYVEVNVIESHSGFDIIEEKCSVSQYRCPASWSNKSLEKDGYVFIITGTYNGKNIIEKKFTTWYNGSHRGYGDTIVVSGWNCTPYLNFDNQGNKIEYKEKTLIETFNSPTAKYQV